MHLYSLLNVNKTKEYTVEFSRLTLQKAVGIVCYFIFCMGSCTYHDIKVIHFVSSHWVLLDYRNWKDGNNMKIASSPELLQKKFNKYITKKKIHISCMILLYLLYPISHLEFSQYIIKTLTTNIFIMYISIAFMCFSTILVLRIPTALSLKVYH